jgi:predicted metal-dependent HD superfamily phosphohydrolase
MATLQKEKGSATKQGVYASAFSEIRRDELEKRLNWRRDREVINTASDILHYGSKKDYFYHNPDHTDYVAKGAEELATAEGLDESEKRLVIIAASYHDVGYVIRYNNNERIGANTAREAMAIAFFSKGEIRVVEKMIVRGTSLTFNAAAGSMEQHPVTELEKILADADMKHLADAFDYFVRRGDLLRMELEAIGAKFTDSSGMTGRWRS